MVEDIHRQAVNRWMRRSTSVLIVLDTEQKVSRDVRPRKSATRPNNCSKGLDYKAIPILSYRQQHDPPPTSCNTITSFTVSARNIVKTTRVRTFLVGLIPHSASTHVFTLATANDLRERYQRSKNTITGPPALMAIAHFPLSISIF